jgi:hypothetical protein
MKQTELTERVSLEVRLVQNATQTTQQWSTGTKLLYAVAACSKRARSVNVAFPPPYPHIVMVPVPVPLCGTQLAWVMIRLTRTRGNTARRCAHHATRQLHHPSADHSAAMYDCGCGSPRLTIRGRPYHVSAVWGLTITLSASWQ